MGSSLAHANFFPILNSKVDCSESDRNPTIIHGLSFLSESDWSLPESAGVCRRTWTPADSTDSGRLRQTPLQESAGLSPVKVLRSPRSLADSGRSPAGLKQQIWPMSHQHSPGFESCRSPPESAGVFRSLQESARLRRSMWGSVKSSLITRIHHLHRQQ